MHDPDRESFKGVHKFCKENGETCKFTPSTKDDLVWRMAQHINGAHQVKWSESQRLAEAVCDSMTVWDESETESEPRRSRSPVRPPASSSSGTGQQSHPKRAHLDLVTMAGVPGHITAGVGVPGQITPGFVRQLTNLDLLQTFDLMKRELVRRGQRSLRDADF